MPTPKFTYHGRTHTPEYRAWRDMLGRCRNPTHASYARYGGRGIRVCARWTSFVDFFADLGERPTPHHTLERVNNAKGYRPGNVEWATWDRQANNKRRNHRIVLFGKVMTVTQAARRHHLNFGTLRGRLARGMTPEQAVTDTPPIGRPKTTVPTGSTFGRLTVLGFAGLGPDRHSLWECRCACGKTTVAYARSIRSGGTKSCGCLRGHRR